MLDTKILGVLNKILRWNKKHLDNPEIEKKIQAYPEFRAFLQKDDLITSGSPKIDAAYKQRSFIIKQTIKKLGQNVAYGDEDSFLDLVVNLTSRIDSQETVIGKLRVAKSALNKQENVEPTTARK
jgi:hypothetical protein